MRVGGQEQGVRTNRSDYRQYLGKWSDSERTERKTQLVASRIKSAKFRKLQTVDAFNFKHSPVTEKIEKIYLTLFHSIAKDSLPSAIGPRGV